MQIDFWGWPHMTIMVVLFGVAVYCLIMAIRQNNEDGI
jgi:hypothetical protein